MSPTPIDPILPDAPNPDAHPRAAAPDDPVWTASEGSAGQSKAVPADLGLAGDHLNADRFLTTHGYDVKWSPELGKWFQWNGSWWSEDRLEKVVDLARQTIDSLRSWAVKAHGAEYRERRNHYRASAKAGRALALLQVARTRPAVAVPVGDLDQHPYLLACRNGTVDLGYGGILLPDRRELLTLGIGIDYDPHARSELWEGFLATTFGGDDELIRYVQRILGYAATGAVAEHIVPVFYGGGANGKSTLVGVVQDLLGGFAITAPEGLFAVARHEPHPERIAVLRGKRLVVSYEMEQQVVLAEQLIKTITGGDRLSGRELYGRRFDFAPTHTVILITNHKPRVRGTDEAIWRRLRLVPFEHTVAPSEQDHDLRRRLVQEHGQAILAWLVRGAVSWYSQGVGECVAVNRATTSYREEEDTMAEFLAECTQRSPGSKVKVGRLWERWQAWTQASGERPGRKQTFSSALGDHGVVLEIYQGVKFAKDLGEVS